MRNPVVAMAAALLFGLVAAASAQDGHVAPRHSITHAIDYISTAECDIPIPPGAPPPLQVIIIESGSKLNWCLETDGSKTATFTWTITVDTSGTFVLNVGCSVGGSPVTCVATIPDPVIDLLLVKATHLITIIGHDPLSNMDTSPVLLYTRRPICSLDGRIFESGDPLPADVTGALRNQQGSLTFEKQVGKLRSIGFLIEWSRAQFGLDTTGLNGYWYMLGWCEGK